MLPAWMINDIRKSRDEDNELGHAAIPVYDYRDHHTDGDSDSVDGDSDSPVLNAGSGGGPSPPPAPDPMAEAQAQMKLEEARAAAEEKNRIAKEERDATKLAADKEAYQGRLSGAYGQAQNYGSSKLAALGINDDYGIMSAYQSALDKAKTGIPDLDPNPGSYFTSSLWDTALGEQRTAARNKLTKQYETAVPSDYATTYIPDTADDALINSIIGGQYTDASAALERAKSRGTLNDTGYGTASKALANQKAGAIAKANEQGLGVLETGRTSLRDIDKEARNTLSNWDFGTTYDPSAYSNRLKTATSGFTSGLEGKLRNAFGDTDFFDTEALIAKGGKGQGAVNTGAAALQDAISEEEKRRTAGSVGAF
jgi:hypothetical protein